MAKNDENGVWRTIGGRRVFIKDGQSLASAMIESGKFKSPRIAYRRDKLKKENDEGYKKFAKILNKDGDKYPNAKKEMLEKYRDFKEYDKANNEINKGIDYSKTLKDYEDEKSNKINETMDKREKIIEKLDNETNDNSNWKAQIKENNDNLEKELKSFMEKNKNNMTNEKIKEEYYEMFRKNERANAKLKKEEPNEKYEFIEAYAGYKDKFNDTWGKDGASDKVVSAKMYTNDEFMEHLEDANWHSERKQLLDANLTNKELEYIKNQTKVSAWGVENLTGKDQVNELINEAKQNAKNDYKLSTYEKEMINATNNKDEQMRNKAIGQRYSGTIDYLKQSTNLGTDEIMKIIKKMIEEGNK